MSHWLGMAMAVLNCCLSYRLTGINVITLEYIFDMYWIYQFHANLSVVLLRLAIKLSLDALLFWYLQYSKQYNPSTRAKSVLGDKNDKDTILIGGELFHDMQVEIAQAIQNWRNEEIQWMTGMNPNKQPAAKDPICGLAPCKTGHRNDSYLVEILTAFHVALDEHDILKALAIQTKCHDYTILVTYQLVYNKALAYGILLLLRWEMWLVIFVYYVAVFPYGHYVGCACFCCGDT